jgi:F-type H+-transporting ATPase subunit delta
MPARSTAAKRYAEAIAGLARDAGSTDAWSRWRDDLERIAQSLDNPVLRLTLESPRVSVERKESLLRERLGGAVSPQAFNLVGLMARRGRVELIPDVLRWFDEFADRALGVKHFVVTSAAPLTDEQRARLTQRLTAGSGQAKITERVDPQILGGLVVQQEDVISDYSVRARLEWLRDRMN